MSDGESGDGLEKSDAVAGQNERLVIRDVTDIKRITIEWSSSKEDGYLEAEMLVHDKYGTNHKTVRIGPKQKKSIGELDTETQQWILDVYV